LIVSGIVFILANYALRFVQQRRSSFFPPLRQIDFKTVFPFVFLCSVSRLCRNREETSPFLQAAHRHCGMITAKMMISASFICFLMLLTVQARSAVNQQQSLKLNRNGFMPLYKNLPPLPRQFLKREILLPYYNAQVKREDDQFDREDRDYRPLMFGKRFPDYQPPMFG
ncbi:hypothetical protein M514_00439, partial [Trichuris suis]